MAKFEIDFNQSDRKGSVATDGDDSDGGPDINFALPLKTAIGGGTTIEVTLSCDTGEATLIVGPDTQLPTSPAGWLRFASDSTFPSGVTPGAESLTVNSGSATANFSLPAAGSVLLRVKHEKACTLDFEMKT